MEPQLSRLSLDTRPKESNTTTKQKGKAPVADSWDEASLSDSDEETENPSGTHKSPVPSAPPPTPISSSTYPTWDSGPGIRNAEHFSGEEERKRPEKSTAVAGRLIAGALGVKAPKKTEEQRAYDRAVKEQEIKKRNREKAAKEKEKEEAEMAQSAVWDG